MKIWYPRRDLNPDRMVRSRASYPLEDEGPRSVVGVQGIEPQSFDYQSNALTVELYA